MAVEHPTAPWYAGGGRGVTQLSRQEAQSFARGILTSTKYRDELKARAESGNLPPQIEVMLWNYAFGKPQEHVDLTVHENLAELSVDQLALRAEAALKALRAAKDVEDTIEGDIIRVA